MRLSIDRRLFLLPLLGLGILASYGFDLLEQVKSVANLPSCKFRLGSVDKTTLAGVSLQGRKQASDINIQELLGLRQAFATNKFPLKFTLNIEVKNPNGSPAGISRFEWILLMDDRELTRGLFDKPVEIPAKQKGAIPLEITLKLQKLLAGKTLDSMVNFGLNIAGEGNKPTRLSLKVKPSLQIAGQTLSYPDWITVTHEFPSK